RGAVAREAGDVGDLETADDLALIFRDHDGIADVAFDLAEDEIVVREVVRILTAPAELIVRKHRDDGGEVFVARFTDDHSTPGCSASSISSGTATTMRPFLTSTIGTLSRVKASRRSLPSGVSISRMSPAP